jgi:hypothetical protein
MANPLPTLDTVAGVPQAANILAGRQTFTSTTGATTIITIPAGRTWIGHVGASVSAAEVAAGTAQPQATATFTTVGTGVTPTAGTYLVIDARSGANAATGVVGDGITNFGDTVWIVAAPLANTVTIAVASTNVGTSALVDAYAFGMLV